MTSHLSKEEYKAKEDGYRSWEQAIAAKRSALIGKPMVRLELPFPPSVNGIYANGGNRRGRHKTKAYQAWEVEASQFVKDSHRVGLGPYSLSIAARRPDKRKRDLGNILKPLEDFLVMHGVISDDSEAVRITMVWDAGLTCPCAVLVMQAEEGMAA